MRRIAILFLFLAGPLWAQQPPYDVFPQTTPPYYRVRHPASTVPGGLAYPATFTVWVPPGVGLLRGVIVHQHGCGEGSCKSGLTGAFDLHWQALARKHRCALLAPSYEQPESGDCGLWCDPRNGSDEAFQLALNELGALSGHLELATLPWALWGHSGGAYWAGGMVLLHPKRVVGAWLRSGAPRVQAETGWPAPFLISGDACQVPVMCNLGTREGVTDRTNSFAGVWPGVKSFFLTLRGGGALIGVAIDPLTSHECGNQRYLAIPWLDACLAARLPTRPLAALKPMPARAAWLAPLNESGRDGIAAVPAGKFTGVKETSVWLPNAGIARAWTQYVRDTAVTDATPPPAPTNLQVRGNTVTWEATADVESGLAHFIIERDGRFLATVPGNGRNPYGRPVFQNLQYSDTPPQPLALMSYTDTTAAPGLRHRYRVIAVNTVGLKSR